MMSLSHKQHSVGPDEGPSDLQVHSGTWEHSTAPGVATPSSGKDKVCGLWPSLSLELP